MVITIIRSSWNELIRIGPFADLNAEFVVHF